MRINRARARAGTIAALATLGSVIAAAPASAASSCSFNTDTATVNVTETGFDTSTISRTAGDGVIELNGNPCDTATVFNTDTIQVVGDSGGQNLTLDWATGGFGPGLSTESTGRAEIETKLALGAGSDKVTMSGNAKAQHWTLGTGGINQNGDDDVDITYSGVDSWVMKGMANDDYLTAAGDALTGSPVNKPVTLLGGAGNDKLLGGNVNDQLWGDADTETGTQVAGAGNDRIYGGDGNDHLAGQDGNDFLNGEDGNDTIDLERGDDSIYGGTGNDSMANTVTGLTAADGADSISGGSGTDSLNLSNRTHNLLISEDNVANDGEDADLDHVAEEGDNVRSDIENIQLGHGDDVADLNTASANAANVGNNVDGGEGNDTITTGTGADTVTGGAGQDVISTGDDNDSLDGGALGDTLYGGAGSDNLTGDPTFGGGAGDDAMYGQSGNDSFSVASTPDGADLISGGTGTDSISYFSRNSDTKISIDGVANDGADTDANGAADEGDNILPDMENITTGGGNDLIDADTDAANAAALENSLSAGNGNDVVRGGAGADTLSGGSGDDTVDGGPGEDNISGGAGTDNLLAQDGYYDVVDGGFNDGVTDTWTADSFDDVSNLP